MQVKPGNFTSRPSLIEKSRSKKLKHGEIYFQEDASEGQQ